VKLYRAMKVDTDGKPLVGTRGSMLGVRPTDPTNTNPTAVFDVDAVNGTDLVRPGEGLSTSPDPKARKPRRSEAVFEIETDDLGPDLTPKHDGPNHCLLQPSTPLSLSDYQQALANTRDLWKRV
jgi:hypothetical protein